MLIELHLVNYHVYMYPARLELKNSEKQHICKFYIPYSLIQFSSLALKCSRKETYAFYFYRLTPKLSLRHQTMHGTVKMRRSPIFDNGTVHKKLTLHNQSAVFRGKYYFYTFVHSRCATYI